MVCRSEFVGSRIILPYPTYSSFSFSAAVQRLVAFRCGSTRSSREETVPESNGCIVPLLDCFTAFYFSLAESIGVNFLHWVKTVSFWGETLKHHGHNS